MQTKSQQQQSQVGGQPKAQIMTVQRKTQKLLRINADDYSTKHLALFWLLFIAFIIAISLLTLALPPTFVTFTNSDMVHGTSLNGCSNPIGFDANNAVYCNPLSSTNPTVGLLVREMSAKNQFFFVYINFVLQNPAQSLLEINSTKIQLQYYDLEERNGPNGEYFVKNAELQNQEADFELKSYEAQRIYESNGFTLKGYRQFFGYQKYIEQQNSLVHFVFSSWPITNVKNVYMEVTTVTPGFTVFSIVIRYVLFAISLGTTIGYYVRYRLIPQNLRTLQQRMVLYLSIFTIMFNDPLYAATVLAPNGFTAFTSVAFIVNFLTFLIAFWMIFMDRILYESGQEYENVVNKRKIAYFVVFYVSLFVLEFQVALLRFKDSPMIIGNQMQSGGIVAFQIISFLIFAAGLVYIGVQYIRNLMKFCDKTWRNQTFLMFSFIFIIVIIVMLAIEGFSVYEYTGSRILIFFGLMNMNTIYLQYMYSINSQEATKLDRQRILGGGQNSRNQVETIVSHFGNQDIMVDLDSQVGSQGFYSQDKKPTRVNKYSHNINQRLESRQQIEDDTSNNLNQQKQEGKNNQSDLYSVQE